jgi:hypothetical protein
VTTGGVAPGVPENMPPRPQENNLAIIGQAKHESQPSTASPVASRSNTGDQDIHAISAEEAVVLECTALLAEPDRENLRERVILMTTTTVQHLNSTILRNIPVGEVVLTAQQMMAAAMLGDLVKGFATLPDATKQRMIEHFIRTMYPTEDSQRLRYSAEDMLCLRPAARKMSQRPRPFPFVTKQPTPASLNSVQGGTAPVQGVNIPSKCQDVSAESEEAVAPHKQRIEEGVNGSRESDTTSDPIALWVKQYKESAMKERNPVQNARLNLQDAKSSVPKGATPVRDVQAPHPNGETPVHHEEKSPQNGKTSTQGGGSPVRNGKTPVEENRPAHCGNMSARIEQPSTDRDKVSLQNGLHRPGIEKPSAESAEPSRMDVRKAETSDGKPSQSAQAAAAPKKETKGLGASRWAATAKTSALQDLAGLDLTSAPLLDTRSSEPVLHDDLYTLPPGRLTKQNVEGRTPQLASRGVSTREGSMAGSVKSMGKIPDGTRPAGLAQSRHNTGSTFFS